MPEVWSIAWTRNGVSGCALDTSLCRRDAEEAWSQTGLSASELLEATGRVLSRLCEGSHEPPLALGILGPDRESAIVADESGHAVSGVLFDDPLSMPLRDIPEPFARDAGASRAWRASAIRRLRALEPAFCLGMRVGIHTVTSWAMRAITGNAADPCLPRGVDAAFPHFAPETREILLDATGYDANLSCVRARAGVAAGNVSRGAVRSLGRAARDVCDWIAGVPVYAQGSSDGARGYACAASPLAWSVDAGWDLRAHWTAGNMALSGWTISLAGPSNADAEPGQDEGNERTADDWTALFDATKSLETSPGPGRELATYGRRLPSACSPILETAIRSIVDPETGRIPAETLMRASTGSHGLHLVCDANGWKIIGLQPSHDAAHLARALFEGEMFHLRLWQEELLEAGFGPIRLTVGAPWPRECAQWAADILGRPVYCLDGSAESAAAFGGALSLLRALHPDSTFRPSLQAQVVEPSARAEVYQKHYGIFRVLAGVCV